MGSERRDAINGKDLPVPDVVKIEEGWTAKLWTGQKECANCRGKFSYTEEVMFTKTHLTPYDSLITVCYVSCPFCNYALSQAVPGVVEDRIKALTDAKVRERKMEQQAATETWWKRPEVRLVVFGFAILIIGIFLHAVF